LAAPIEELAVHFSLHQTEKTRAAWNCAVMNCADERLYECVLVYATCFNSQPDNSAVIPLWHLLYFDLVS